MVLLTALFAVATSAAADAPTHIALLLSRDIRPYVEAAEGFTEEMKRFGIFETQRFNLQDYTGKSEEILIEKLKTHHFALYVVVGPEALRLTAGNFSPLVYMMVLNPDEVMGPSAAATICGVSFRIPVRHQVASIRQALPEVRRVGLLYDPEHNEAFYEDAALCGTAVGLTLVPLRVTSTRKIGEVLNGVWSGIEAIWLIPDQTVISESIVKFILKESLLRRIPAVGFNRFFHDSGAAVTFVFNYKTIGRQAATLSSKVLSEGACTPMVPAYEVLPNEKVATKFGIHVRPIDPGEPVGAR